MSTCNYLRQITLTPNSDFVIFSDNIFKKSFEFIWIIKYLFNENRNNLC
jgi:hypothetical protein